MAKKQKSHNRLMLALTIVIAFSIAFFINPLFNYADEFADNQSIARLLTFLFFALCLYLGIFIQIVLHELGHLVCGLISGYKFYSFRILSFCFVKTDGKIKLKKLTIPGTAGQCLMLPPPINNGDRPYKLYNYGGVIFNIAFSLIFLAVALLFNSDVFVYALFGIFAVNGIILAINNGVPATVGFVQNDAKNVIDAGASKEAVDSFFFQLEIAHAQANGSRLSDLPDEYFTMPNDSDIDNPIVATKAYVICEREIEKGNFYNAHVLIRELLAKAPSILPLYKALLQLELIYLDTIHNWASDENVLARYKEQAQIVKALKKSPSVQRIAYTVALLIEKDKAKANAHLVAFEKQAKKYPYQQEIDGERKLINLATEKANQSI